MAFVYRQRHMKRQMLRAFQQLPRVLNRRSDRTAVWYGLRDWRIPDAATLQHDADALCGICVCDHIFNHCRAGYRGCPPAAEAEVGRARSRSYFSMLEDPHLLIERYHSTFYPDPVFEVRDEPLQPSVGASEPRSSTA